jgi:hypothetical protein
MLLDGQAVDNRQYLPLNLEEKGMEGIRRL